MTAAVQRNLSQRKIRSVPGVFLDGFLCRTFSGRVAHLFNRDHNIAEESGQLVVQLGTLLPKSVNGMVELADLSNEEEG